MNFDPLAGLTGQPIQQFWTEQWSRTLQTLQQMGQPGMQGMPQAWKAAVPEPAALTETPLTLDPEKLLQLQQQYLEGAKALYEQGGAQALLSKDKRFNAESWADNPLTAVTAATYLLNSRMLTGLADAVQADDKTRNRVRFAVEQWLAAMAPSNFLALNAEAQKKAIETQGESLAQGVANLLADMRQGHVSMTDEKQFTVGRNVATTEGAVVFENDLFQLIEYKPLTDKVHERPFLMVPPCINKFYILDLQPDNSLIRYAVSQGHRTFVMSWRNPDDSLARKTWDDYIEEGVLTGMRVARDIAGADQINVLGFCVGGTMLSTALAVLQARHDREQAAAPKPSAAPAKRSTAGRAAARTTASRVAAPAGVPFPVASMTLLTTFIDFSDTGILDVFIDESVVRFREMQMGEGGLMKGQDLASTFSFLRPNDLVWNYVVGNYLKGETPPPFDLLYWNSDCTNLPGPYYAWYLRNLYLENKLAQPGALTVCGERIDMHQLCLPAYIYGSREDHIVPVGGSYASTQVLGGDKRFVMGASGHIAGVINPPAKKKRSYWLREDGQLPPTLKEWQAGADEHPGSWWADWSPWLSKHGGKLVAAPKQYGRGREYTAIEPAPGRYVLAKA
ncbi:Poly-beta-hydroxybutyrate polymerase [Delftia tsuruhatensis]|uniref:PHA/PHB synthase family protein n=1 Tax=Delftia tsuruhatensis TaxID=180282 RepID=UPI001E768720|nr:alpha/beta fold hydrolase [Delftia tsuruhatensis]CAB5707643.1 Poly-beta-hydroxybutyrate polymerase [Delftia tsuruhatensis]CAC9684975.1 Poly-beta-hydroxybutyrate polymerase [Delftia tsuruhatensis]